MPLGGYSRLIEDAAAGLDIRLNEPVHKVLHGPMGIVIRSKRETHIADAAVVGVPLGLLQSQRLTFDPALPFAKQAAISRIGFGAGAVLGKLILRFSQRFWPDGEDRFSMLPPSPIQRGRFYSWTDLSATSGCPMLVGFATGRRAAEYDTNMDDDVICADAIQSLRHIFGPQIPRPDGAYYTRWLSDPWSRGSYSYPAVGSDADDRRQYAEAIGDRLYLVGEATDEKAYGTVHAALRSGERVALSIFEHAHRRKPDISGLPWAQRNG